VAVRARSACRITDTFGSGLSSPVAVAVDAAGNVYVVNYLGHVVDKIAPDGTTTTFGSGFNSPYGVAVDTSGNVYVADLQSSQIAKLSPDGSGGYTQSEVGSGFASPQGVAVDASGNVFVADTGNGRTVKIDQSGNQTTVNPNFYSARAVAVDASGSVYMANTNRTDVEEVIPSFDGLAQSITVRALPSRPRLVTTKLTGSKLKISWSAPFSNGGSSILGYRVTASPGGASCTTSGALTCTITGLRRSTRYSISVVARNVVGTTTPTIVRNVVG
jgi:Fibronectin type III domain/NHL repeat